MPIQAEKGIDVTIGNHTGVMSNPQMKASTKEKRGPDGRPVKEEFFYLEYDVKTDGKEAILKVSWPANLTPQSDLGLLLDRIGQYPKEGETWDEASLDGQRIAYTVKADGRFVRIDPNTVNTIE